MIPIPRSPIPSLAIRVHHPELADYPVVSHFTADSFEPRQELINDPFLKKLNEFYLSFKKPYVLAYEMADDEVPRSHTHCVLHTEKDSKQFGKELHKKQWFPEMTGGNKDFGTKPVNDLSGALQYALKGPFQGEVYIVGSYGYTKDELEYYHNNYWEIWKKRKTSLPKETKVVNKVKTPTWTERVVDEAKFYFEGKDITKKTVYRFAMEKLGKSAKVLDEYIVKKLVLGIFNAIAPEPLLSEFRETLYEKIFGEF